MADILSLDPDGRIIIRWGTRTLHVWNFGSKVPSLDKNRRASTDRTPRTNKKEISLNIRDDLQAWEDEKAEAEEKSKVLERFALSGLSEEEMIQYAQLLSMTDNRAGSPSKAMRPSHLPNNLQKPHSPHESSSDDADLQLALRLSLLEQ